MKKYRKITAIIAAALLTSALMMPAVTYAEGTSSITINSSSAVSHSYEAYQIITGDISGEKLVHLKWGSGISTFNSTSVTPGNNVSDEDIGLIKSKTGKELVSLFDLSASPTATASGTGSVEFSGLDSGYYLIKDVTDLSATNDANSAWILETAGTVTVSVKSAKPSVDKQVRTGGDDDTPVWDETADYSMFQQMQFRLSATIPISSDLNAYNSYKIEFEDNLSEGLTFEAIKSVKAGNVVLTENTDYTMSISSGKLKVTIDDIKSLLGNKWGAEENVIEVIYTASLNENAIISKNETTPQAREISRSAVVNHNGVCLNYSNNPYFDGSGTEPMGKTPEDKVWIFTYGVDNTKYKDAVASENVLAGAKFKLYNSSDKSHEIPMIFDSGKNAYRPAKSGESGTEIISLSDGTFNIIGIDAGTYYLSEAEPPAGYNKCDDIIIVIDAEHQENYDGESAWVKFTDKTNNTANSVIDKAGATLPSTGGIGTKVFYITGGILVAGSGILLVTKKRMSKKDN